MVFPQSLIYQLKWLVWLNHDLNELLTDPEIELVTICTPAHTHYDLAKQAILAGKSVIS
jgi:predicted dehydrogenase